MTISGLSRLDKDLVRKKIADGLYCVSYFASDNKGNADQIGWVERKCVCLFENNQSKAVLNPAQAKDKRNKRYPEAVELAKAFLENPPPSLQEDLADIMTPQPKKKRKSSGEEHASQKKKSKQTKLEQSDDESIESPSSESDNDVIISKPVTSLATKVSTPATTTAHKKPSTPKPERAEKTEKGEKAELSSAEKAHLRAVKAAEAAKKAAEKAQRALAKARLEAEKEARAKANGYGGAKKESVLEKTEAVEKTGKSEDKEKKEKDRKSGGQKVVKSEDSKTESAKREDTKRDDIRRDEVKRDEVKMDDAVNEGRRTVKVELMEDDDSDEESKPIKKSRKRVEVTSDEDSSSGSEKEKKPLDKKKRKLVGASETSRPSTTKTPSKPVNLKEKLTSFTSMINGGNTGDIALMQSLQELKKLDVTIDLLKETGAGLAINSVRKDKTRSEEVRNVAADIRKIWEARCAQIQSQAKPAPSVPEIPVTSVAEQGGVRGNAVAKLSTALMSGAGPSMVLCIECRKVSSVISIIEVPNFPGGGNLKPTEKLLKRIEIGFPDIPEGVSSDDLKEIVRNFVTRILALLKEINEDQSFVSKVHHACIAIMPDALTEHVTSAEEKLKLEFVPVIREVFAIDSKGTVFTACLSNTLVGSYLGSALKTAVRASTAMILRDGNLRLIGPDGIERLTVPDDVSGIDEFYSKLSTGGGFLNSILLTGDFIKEYQRICEHAMSTGLAGPEVRAALSDLVPAESFRKMLGLFSADEIPVTVASVLLRKVAVDIPSTGSTTLRDLSGFDSLLRLGFVTKQTYPISNEDNAKKRATDLERAVFDLYNGDTSSDKYRDKVRMLTYNLGPRGNSEIRAKLLEGALTSEAVANMSANDLANSSLQEYRNQVKKEATKRSIDATSDTSSVQTTDQFKCGGCGERKCTYKQMQTRSADEPMTTFISCLNCGKNWKE